MEKPIDDVNDSELEKPEEDTEAKAEDHATDQAPKEIGGRDGPDPTRYGDWEKGGRCIDF